MERENNYNINNKERRRNRGCRKEWEREGDNKQGEDFFGEREWNRDGTKGGRKEDGEKEVEGMEDGNREGKEGEKKQKKELKEGIKE